MYLFIVIIGWLYVTVLIALTEPNWVASVLSFVFYGLAPAGVLLAIFRPRRRPLFVPRKKPPAMPSVLPDTTKE